MEISVIMEAKQLMIGNYVERKAFDPWEKYFSLTTVGFADIEACFRSKESFKPIPLTKEWLLKLGFANYQWCENSAFIKLECGKSLYLRFYSDKWSCRKADIGKDEKGFYIKNTTKNTVLEAGKLKHVHQLQNLFFALTGEELTVKN